MTAGNTSTPPGSINIAVRPAVTTTLMILAWIYLAAVVGWISWWWGWRRRHIPATVGMSVVGLRRVHLARSTRIVRTRDIPGARRGPFEVLGALAWALLVVAIVTYGGYAWVSGYVSSSKTNQQAQIQDALNDTTQAVSLVEDIYQKVLAGRDVTDSFAPAALSAANQLSARHAMGVFDEYYLTQVQLPDYKPIISYSNATGRMIVALVSITESQRQASVTYEYRVVYRVTRAEQNGNGGFIEGRWLIEDVTQVS